MTTPLKERAALKVPVEIFKGVKIACFAWAMVGPYAACFPGYWGATVLRIESKKHPDVNRGLPPFFENQGGIERSCVYNSWATNRYGVSLDLNHPKGPEIGKRICQWADIVAESYTGGTMKKWGLDYDSVRQYNPNVIYYSTCGFGQTGPWASMPGHGGTMTAFSGLQSITGWPDRNVSVSLGGPSDFLTSNMAITALISALLYKKRTGKGMFLDMSQYEALVAELMPPVLLNYRVNGREWTLNGNRNAGAAPHGAFRCKGNDRWIAIEVFNDKEWEAFCKVLGNPAWTRQKKFSTFIGRKQNEDELEKLITEWTSQQDKFDIMKKLQAAGVGASSVNDPKDVFEDPHLQFRKMWTFTNHPVTGKSPSVNFPEDAKLSKTPGYVTMPSPTIGQHNEMVYTNILGMAQTEYEELNKSGVFE